MATLARPYEESIGIYQAFKVAGIQCIVQWTYWYIRVDLNYLSDIMADIGIAVVNKNANQQLAFDIVN